MTTPASDRPRAVTVGEGLAVLVAQPGPLADSESFARAAGGAEANVATVLSQLDVAAGWISRVGDDGFGRYLLRTLVERGVDVSAVVTDPTRPTGLYVKERGRGTGSDTDLGEGESRMLYYRSGSAGSALSPADLATPAAARWLLNALVVHVTGITPALSPSATALCDALVTMPRSGRLVSFDVNFRPALWTGRADEATRVLTRLARSSDIVFMGADEATQVFGTGDPAELRELFSEPEHLIVKDDEHTVTGFHGPERVDVPALRLDVVEKIGAGDAFAGGFLSGLLHGLGHAARIRLGHVCAAAALAGHGDVATLPPLHQLERLLALDAAEWSNVRVADELAGRAS